MRKRSVCFVLLLAFPSLAHAHSHNAEAAARLGGGTGSTYWLTGGAAAFPFPCMSFSAVYSYSKQRSDDDVVLRSNLVGGRYYWRHPPSGPEWLCGKLPPHPENIQPRWAPYIEVLAGITKRAEGSGSTRRDFRSISGAVNSGVDFQIKRNKHFHVRVQADSLIYGIRGLPHMTLGVSVNLGVGWHPW